jgi:hypothetical protein
LENPSGPRAEERSCPRRLTEDALRTHLWLFSDAALIGGTCAILSLTNPANQFRRDEWITIKGTSLTILKPDQLERLTA